MTLLLVLWAMVTSRHMGPISHHFLHHHFLKPLKSSLCLFLFCLSLRFFLKSFDFQSTFSFRFGSGLFPSGFLVAVLVLSIIITELEMGKGESELELGLALSLGGVTAAMISKGGGAWGERGRLLTAKDFPSVGSKRAADSASHAGASPPRSSQVVGWPPIGSHRMNSLVNNQATKSAKEEEEEEEEAGKKDDETKDVTKKVQAGFIKVKMDGVAIGRKVDLNAHSSYESLAHTLEDMFFGTSSGTTGLTGQFTKPLRLLDGSSEFGLTYQDKEGDWMLVGDVPWRMFITSVNRLRVMKTSEANGLASRHQEPNERERNRPV